MLHCQQSLAFNFCSRAQSQAKVVGVWMLARNPMRMAGEQAVHEADLVSNKYSKCDADQARGHSEMTPDTRKALLPIGKSGSNRQGYEHHSQDRADAKHSQVSYRPSQDRDCAQHKQCNRGRSEEHTSEFQS